MPHALQVFRDDEDGQYHWAVLEERGEDSGVFSPLSAGEEAFPTYADALNAGAVALAAAAREPYENEAADPVGELTGAAPSNKVPVLAPSAYVSRDDLRKVSKGKAGGTRPGQTSNRYGSLLRDSDSKR